MVTVTRPAQALSRLEHRDMCRRRGTMRLQDLSEFVRSIYDTALDSNACPPMLNRLADLLGATSGAHFGSYNSRTYVTRNVAPRFDQKYIRSFAEYWGSRDIFWQRGANHPVGAVFMPETFMSREEHCRTDIFNEWYKPQRAEGVDANKPVDRGSGVHGGHGRAPLFRGR